MKNNDEKLAISLIKCYTSTTKIMIGCIEDSEFDRMILDYLLKHLMIGCQTFSTPEIAAEAIKENPLDLVITDWFFPEDSSDVGDLYPLSYIKSDEHLKDIPIIVLSALPHEEVKKKALENGALFWLEKPITSIAIIDKLLEIFLKRDFNISNV